jgi:hypothetical protein
MLDDGLSGDTSTFVLPPELAAGRYLLCTANSEPNQCITDGADHHRGHVRTTAPALAEYSESAASRTERSRLGSRVR